MVAKMDIAVSCDTLRDTANPPTAITPKSQDFSQWYIDVVRKASEAEVAMVVKEDDLGDLRVSLRSKGIADVSAVAIGLGGGGHRYAAGFTASSRDLTEVVDAVRRALDAALDA